jgi:hypothetical protein
MDQHEEDIGVRDANTGNIKKSIVLQQREEMNNRRARKLHRRELNICIKDMHAHMRRRRSSGM